jgi:hypothetical protein
VKTYIQFIAAGLTALLATAAASADPIKFKTEFDFDPSTAAIDGTYYFDAAHPSYGSLTLTGLNSITSDVPAEDVVFGSLAFATSNKARPVDHNFLLKITMLDPSSGAGQTTANFWGTVNTRSATGAIELLGGSIEIGGYKFTLQDTDVTLSAREGLSMNLLGSVESLAPTSNAVPVPMAVWGGTGLLGVLGAGEIRKRRRALI